MSLNFVCATADVQMLRVDFPSTARLVGETAVKGAVCRDSTARSWFCIFAYGSPAAAGTPLTATVRFKAAAPRGRQRGEVTYFLQSPGGPGVIDASTSQSAAFSY